MLVVERDGLTAYVAGYAYPQTATGQTVFVYYAAIAPADRFAAATDEAFVPIFYQFNPGTGSGEPEPPVNT